MATTRIGDFELLTKLGEGGMGAVYKARQVSLDRVVALKLLPPKLASNPDFIERFQREARATAKLNHPNIIAGYDVGEAGGYHYFAMEFIEGETLKAQIKREGSLPEAEVLRIGAAVAAALQHAHVAGIIHRDVKPDNILLDKENTPKLADLGLAKAAAQEQEDGTLTKTGATVGTPHYMAPEQARGEKDIDGRTDTYALGCTLYHAATGKTPFDGTTTAVLMVKHINEKMPHPQSLCPSLSDGFCAILGRMVARSRADRYLDLKEAAEDLELVRAGLEPRRGPLPPAKLNFLPNPRTVQMGSSSRNVRMGPRDSSNRLEAVGERRRSHRESAAGMTSWLPYAAGGGVLVAMLLLYFLLGGSKSIPPEPKKTAKVTPEKSSEEKSMPKDAPVSPPPQRVAPPLSVPESGTKVIVAPAPVQPVPLSVQAAPIVQPSPNPATQAVLALFNGRDTSNWHVERGTWTVEQGMLCGKNNTGNAFMVSLDWFPGDAELILTASTTLGFHFGCGLRDATAGGCNMLHVEDTGNLRLTWYEEPKGNKDLASATLKNLHEFHTYRLVFQGASIRVFVDGTLLLQTKEGQPAKGVDRQIYLFVAKDSDTRFKTIEARAPPCDGQAVSAPVENADLGALTPEKQAEWVLSKLKDLNPGFDGKGKPTIEGAALVGLEIEGANIKDLSPLRGLKGLKKLALVPKPNITSPFVDLSPLKGLPLTDFSCDYSAVADLSPLKGMPLERLNIAATQVADLSPLKGAPLKELMCPCTKMTDLKGLAGLPLEKLWIYGSPFDDLSPLKGMKLTWLDCSYTQVKDLSVLKGMPLEVLFVNDTKVAELSIMKGMPLTTIRIDFKPERDTALLKGLGALISINGQEPKDFFMKNGKP